MRYVDAVRHADHLTQPGEFAMDLGVLSPFSCGLLTRLSFCCP